MNTLDHERIRAYVDGELAAEESASLLADARASPELRRELEEQLDLHRALAGLPTPTLPFSLQARPTPGRWLGVILGERPLRIPAPLFAAAAVILFGSGALLGPRLVAHPSSNVAARELVPQRFVFMNGAAKSVALAGSFNHWSPTATPLHSVGDGIWEVTLSLPRGEHRYIFQVDGTWTPDVLADQLVPDGMGNLDAVIQL